MNFQNFSSRFFRNFTGSKFKVSQASFIKNDFKRAFIFNRISIANINTLTSSSLMKKSLPFLGNNGVCNFEGFSCDIFKEKLLALLEGIENI